MNMNNQFGCDEITEMYLDSLGCSYFGGEEKFVKDFRDLYVWRNHIPSRSSATSCRATSRNMNCTASPAKCADVPLRSLPTSPKGCGKRSNGDFQRFLGIAAGSASELEYHFLLARDLELMTADQYKALNSSVLEVKRMLATLILKIENERLAGGLLSAECYFLKLSISRLTFLYLRARITK